MGEERDEDEGVSQGLRGRHIKKRALRNKALAVGFNDKDLKDYVTGFHKRKKKRRKEALINLEEKARLKRIELRKKRKQDREFVQFGEVQPASGSEADEAGDDHEQDEENEEDAPLPVEDTKTYDNGDITITVKTTDISREEDDDSLREKKTVVPRSGETEKKHSIPVKKKPLKTTVKGGKRRSLPKPQKKRDRKMGKKKSKKGH